MIRRICSGLSLLMLVSCGGSDPNAGESPQSMAAVPSASSESIATQFGISPSELLVKCARMTEAANAQASKRAGGMQLQKDDKGRVSKVYLGGHEATVMYDETQPRKPIGVYGPRGLVLFAQQGSDASSKAVAKAKARVLLYRGMRATCGLEAADPTKTKSSLIEQDEDTPEEWFSPDFWSDYWMPSFQQNFNYSEDGFNRPCSQSVETCEKICDVLGDLNAVGCGAIGGIVAVGNPGLGIIVGAACATGAVAGKYACKADCKKPCRG